MENNARYIESCGAGERAGLYYTCVNSYLTAEELAYILDNSQSKVLITSQAKRDVALAALRIVRRSSFASSWMARATAPAYRQSRQGDVAAFPATPIADEFLGTAMLYSSGTTGRPKGIVRPLPESPPTDELPIFDFLEKLWRYREGMIYLSPAPLYHSAPQAAVSLTIRHGRHGHHHGALRPRGLSAARRETPGDPQPARADDVLAHAQAAGRGAPPLRPVVPRDRDPCRRALPGSGEGADDRMVGADHPRILRRDRRAWASLPAIRTEWLAHKGTVGRVLLGELHVLDDEMKPSSNRNAGHLWFKTATPFEYFNDPAKTRQARSRRRHHEHGGRCRLRRRRTAFST